MSSSKQATAYMNGAKINRVTAIGGGVPQHKRKKSKGTNGMFKWFAKKMRDAMREVNREEDSEISPVRETVGRDRSSDERITLRLEKAIGGHIVTVSKYNGKIDRHRENTYLIKEEDNLEEALTGVFISEKLSM
jgi:hypothetical protein